MKKRIDVTSLPSVVGTLYPPSFDVPCRARERTKLGDAAGLTQFGVNLLRLPPGAWSSQRHWHTREDEFVYVLSGEVVLVTDGGEEVLRAGDAAGFPAETATVIASKTAPTMMPRCSRSGPASRAAAAITRISIWSRRQGASLPSTRIEMEPHTQISGGAAPSNAAWCNPRLAHFEIEPAWHGAVTEFFQRRLRLIASLPTKRFGRPH
jgi:Cupin domain